MTQNSTPTIGIVTQPTFDAGQYGLCGSSYVAGGYVKWIEMAGVQAFVVPWDLPEDRLNWVLARGDGLLLPGGPQKNTLPPHPYFRAIKRIFDKVVARNQSGEYFPLLGICQGFEELIWSATDFGPELCINCVDNTENVLLACDFTEYGENCRMLNSSRIPELDKMVKEALKTDITPNFHSNAVMPNAFRESTALTELFEIVSTSVNDSGPEFVSIIEGKTLPIYGLQWHTSLQVFEWSPKLSCLTHTPEAVLVMQYLANFIAGELRKNENQFAPGEFEDIKFSNLPSVYAANLKDGPIFENAYFFGPPVKNG